MGNQASFPRPRRKQTIFNLSKSGVRISDADTKPYARSYRRSEMPFAQRKKLSVRAARGLPVTNLLIGGAAKARPPRQLPRLGQMMVRNWMVERDQGVRRSSCKR